MKRMPQPIPYQGSKRNIARQILAYFPDNVGCLIEPFAGSAAISVLAAYLNVAESYHLNDLNKPLIELLELIITDPETISDSYEKIWTEQLGKEKEFYNKVRDRFNTNHQPDDLLYLLARCVKASVRYNSNGDFNQGPDNRRKGRTPASMRKEIFELSRLLKGKTTFSSVHYTEMANLIEPDSIVYMDPPYQGTSNGRDARYYSSLGVSELIDFLTVLNSRNVMYLLSYDGHKGGKRYGVELPEDLNLSRVEIHAGRSTQSTLLGENHTTYESLYISPALRKRLHSLETSVSVGSGVITQLEISLS